MVKIIVAPGKWSLRLRIGAAALGLSAGLTVGLYFIRVANIHVIFWGFFSGKLFQSVPRLLSRSGRKKCYCNIIICVEQPNLVRRLCCCSYMGTGSNATSHLLQARTTTTTCYQTEERSLHWPAWTGDRLLCFCDLHRVRDCIPRWCVLRN